MFLDPNLLVHSGVWLLGYHLRKVPVGSALGPEVATVPGQKFRVPTFTLGGLTGFPGIFQSLCPHPYPWPRRTVVFSVVLGSKPSCLCCFHGWATWAVGIWGFCLVGLGLLGIHGSSQLSLCETLYRWEITIKERCAPGEMPPEWAMSGLSKLVSPASLSLLCSPL